MNPRRFGPTRGELQFRLAFSLGGMALLGAGTAVMGVPSGPAFVELFLFIGLFFGGTAIWSLRRLIKGLHP
jgi:hypothetical protein